MAVENIIVLLAIISLAAACSPNRNAVAANRNYDTYDNTATYQRAQPAVAVAQPVAAVPVQTYQVAQPVAATPVQTVQMAQPAPAYRVQYDVAQPVAATPVQTVQMAEPIQTVQMAQPVQTMQMAQPVAAMPVQTYDMDQQVQQPMYQDQAQMYPRGARGPVVIG